MNFKQNQLKKKIRKAHANVNMWLCHPPGDQVSKATLTSMVVSGECFFTESLWFERAFEITLDKARGCIADANK